MTKFYYKTLVFKPKGAFGMVPPVEEIEEELNRLGEFGWELASITAIPNTSNLVVILKNTESNLSQSK